MDMFSIVFLVVGILLGALLLGLWQRGSLAASTAQAAAMGSAADVAQARLQERLSSAQDELARLGLELDTANQQATAWRDQLDAVRDEGARLTERASRVPQLEQTLHELQSRSQSEITQLNEMLAGFRSRLDVATAALASERQQSAEKLQILTHARDELSNQFKALANEILEEKSKRFTEQNQTNLGALLDPLRLKLQEFQGKVEEVYVNEGKDRSALAEQVKQLMALNQQLSSDAHNLTRALKGQSKAQGNWGELILERVLETSGLTRGMHYVAQESYSRDDGSRAQPDVIINLPEGRHLVVDAKVSLTAYDEYVNADTDLAREAAVKRHLDSVRGHIKGLSSKNYQEIYDLKSLDFVLMFIPIEPAFMLAISQDSELWQDAWKQNVLLVSPSTLLFTVRTVAHLWRQEQQNRNAQDIAKRGGELYDKLVGFVEDLEGLGSRLDQAQKSYEKAYNKFTGGRGNVIRQAEMLRDLGIKPTKTMPIQALGIAMDGEVDGLQDGDGD